MKKGRGVSRDPPVRLDLVEAVLLPRGALELEKFVLHFEFLALECCDHQIVGEPILAFRLDHPIQLLMAPFQRGDVAFSRHSNSFQRVGRGYRHKYFILCRRRLKGGRKSDAKLCVIS